MIDTHVFPAEFLDGILLAEPGAAVLEGREDGGRIVVEAD